MGNTSRFSFISVSISLLTFYLLAIIFFFYHPNCSPGTDLLTPLRITWSSSSSQPPNYNITYHHHDDPSPPPITPPSTTTSINHLVFGLVGSTKAWRHRKSYIESWWRPNVTRGYLYLDTPPTKDLLPWSPASPPFRISDDNTKLLRECNHIAPVAVRIVHAVLEVFREGDEGVRWYVMGDDDSIFFVDNMVDVLSKYDHTKYIYIGGHSESLMANFIHSFEMGFGGAGFALSYPLAKVVVNNLEDCIRRYPSLFAADQILMSCVADFGVSVNFEKGLHQIDLRGDISGLLSSHPQAPLLSLHHFDIVKPIFPSMNSFDSAKHIMRAANVDQSRLLQQTICYHKPSNWTLSTSWGYSTHIYEKIISRSILKRPLETFTPWVQEARPPLHLLNTRPLLLNDPCEAPHIYSFKLIEKLGSDQNHLEELVTSYVRVSPRGLPACFSSGNHSAEYVKKIRVFWPLAKPIENGKAECCDVQNVGSNKKTVNIKIRACLEDELIA